MKTYVAPRLDSNLWRGCGPPGRHLALARLPLSNERIMFRVGSMGIRAQHRSKIWSYLYSPINKKDFTRKYLYVSVYEGTALSSPGASVKRGTLDFPNMEQAMSLLFAWIHTQ